MFVSKWVYIFFFFFKQKTAYEMRISDWSSDVCSSDLRKTQGEGNAAKILERIVRQRPHNRIQRMAVKTDQQCIAVRLGAQHILAGDLRCSTRLVFDHDVAIQQLGQLGLNNTGGDVGTTTGRKGTTSRMGSRSEEHTSELQSLMRISYAVFCLKKK